MKRATFNSQEDENQDKSAKSCVLDTSTRVQDANLRTMQGDIDVSAPKLLPSWVQPKTMNDQDLDSTQKRTFGPSTEQRNMHIRRASFATCSNTNFGRSLNLDATKSPPAPAVTNSAYIKPTLTKITTPTMSTKIATPKPDLNTRRASFATCSRSLPMYPTWATINPINQKNLDKPGCENYSLDEQYLTRNKTDSELVSDTSSSVSSTGYLSLSGNRTFPSISLDKTPPATSAHDDSNHPGNVGLKRYPTWATINPISNQKSGKFGAFTKNSSAPSDLDSMITRHPVACVTPQNTPDSPKFRPGWHLVTRRMTNELINFL